MPKKVIFFILALVILVAAFALSGDVKKTTELANLPPAQASTIVDLANGDIYEMKAEYVSKELSGKKLKMLAYNGMIPGPTLRVKEGDEVTIRFTNNMDMPTLLHSHGVRMENKFDGSQSVQEDIQPGETFDYVLRLDDPGAYWYHPHVREDIQQPMGLYGSFLVTPNDLAYWPPADHEEALFLSDVLIENGELAPFSEEYVTHALMGRFGNTLLVNGDIGHTIIAKPGEVHRFYLTNAASVRPFNFRIVGAKMKLIGGDNGPYERETFVESVIVSPSERAIVDVYFPQEGVYAIEHVVPGGKTYVLGEAKASGERVNLASATFETLRTNEQFAPLRAAYFAQAPDKRIRLTVDMDMAKIMGFISGDGHDHMHGEEGMMHAAVPIEWEDEMGDMNTFSTSESVRWIIRDEETGKENMDINWAFAKDSLVKIRITNDATSMHPMQHPVHFHGNRFVVLSVNGVPNDNMVWKDTTLVQTGDTLDVLLETSNPGVWMAHCHIAEHLHGGMMFTYEVE